MHISLRHPRHLDVKENKVGREGGSHKKSFALRFYKQDAFDTDINSWLLNM